MTFLSVQEFDSNGEIQALTGVVRRLTISEELPEHKFAKGQIKTEFETKPLTREDLVPLDSLELAEKYVFEFDIFSHISMPPMNHIPEEEHLAENIRRASGNIATHSKRGPGNTVVFHPELADQLADTMEKYPNMDFIPTESANKTCVLVLYRGVEDADQPLIYVPNEGLIINNRLSNIAHYGKFVRV